MAVAANPAMPNEAAPLDDSREARAVVAIDAEAAEIVAANASGSAALGLFPYASFPIGLDPTMPAIAKLRQIASTGSVGTGNLETLLFLSSGRLRRVKCRITRQAGSGPKILLLDIEAVEMPDDPRSAPSRTSIAAPAGKVATGGPPVETRDAPTLAALDPDYLAKLAHELKTPLTAIAAAAEIMRDERLGEMKNARYRSYAADIHESATHALDVISSLLADRTKPAAPVARLVALDLDAIVQRTVSSVQALAESCGLKLSFEADGSKPHVVANPTGLRQILLNLLTNAIKFTPRGGEVRVSTARHDDGRVVLIVRDTGRGMTGSSMTGSVSAADLQLAWARSNGIGLPLVEALVRDMGAEIQIDSAPQKGTTAKILFSDFTRRFR